MPNNMQQYIQETIVLLGPVAPTLLKSPLS